MTTARVPIGATESTSADATAGTSVCSNCRFAFIRPDRLLECRANAPISEFAGQRPQWPIVGGNDWCGVWSSIVTVQTPVYIVAKSPAPGNSLSLIPFDSAAAAAIAAPILTGAGFTVVTFGVGP